MYPLPMSQKPALIAAATSATAWSPDEHCLLTVLTGTVSGMGKKKNVYIMIINQNHLPGSRTRIIQTYTRETSIKCSHSAFSSSQSARCQYTTHNNVTNFTWVQVGFLYYSLQQNLIIMFMYMDTSTDWNMNTSKKSMYIIKMLRQ